MAKTKKTPKKAASKPANRINRMPRPEAPPPARNTQSQAERVATGKEFMTAPLAIPSTEPPDTDDEAQGIRTKQ